ncbi:MAG: LapA family protein [Rhabdaerophilum sp.]
MLRVLKLLLIIPIAVALVLLAVANRQVVTLVLDPLHRGPDAMSITMPLFVIALITLLVGVVLGYVAAWFAQGKYRRSSRQLQRECDKLQTERAQLRAAVPPTATALLSQK